MAEIIIEAGYIYLFCFHFC